MNATLTRTFHKLGHQLKKHSPEILLGAGVIGTVVGAVMACKATTKLQGILDETKESVEAIHEVVESGEYGDEYTAEDGKKDLAIVYAQTGLKLVKLYGPALAVGTASIGCILASHNILHKRNLALAAAYTAVDTSFKNYRSRVVDRFGKALDRELKYNIHTQEVEETVVDEKGKEKVVKTTVEISGPRDHSEYARCFDETCPNWTKDAEYNLMFIKQQQNYANDKLRHEGIVFLNDVYKMLGFQLSKAGQQVGWVYDESGDGDNFIDFGIHDLHDANKRAFVNGYERSIWLDFNVDGVVYDKLR